MWWLNVSYLRCAIFSCYVFLCDGSVICICVVCSCHWYVVTVAHFLYIFSYANQSIRCNCTILRIQTLMTGERKRMKTKWRQIKNEIENFKIKNDVKSQNHFNFLYFRSWRKSKTYSVHCSEVFVNCQYLYCLPNSVDISRIFGFNERR